MGESIMPSSGLELRSIVRPEGLLELSLHRVDIDAPAPGEVVVRVEAAPINPTDVGLLLGPADSASATAEGEGDAKRVTVTLSPEQLTASSSRLGLSLCPGLEAAGTVIAAGPGVDHLVGRAVAMFGGGMFAEYRRISVADCLVLPEATAPAAAAASFVNPLTALGMVQTTRREGHGAMVFTAAASSLGQMLNRLCLAEGVDVVNIVRRREQLQLLRDLGARYVCDSSAPDFEIVLTGMLRATGATLAFDAIGGGELGSTILRLMEAVHAPKTFSQYGSSVKKQLYVYGALDRRPIALSRTAGLAWSVSGWLLMHHLATLDEASIGDMKSRVLREIDTTFRSSFGTVIRLNELMDPAVLESLRKHATGKKYLIVCGGLRH